MPKATHQVNGGIVTKVRSGDSKHTLLSTVAQTPENSGFPFFLSKPEEGRCHGPAFLSLHTSPHSHCSP